MIRDSGKAKGSSTTHNLLTCLSLNRLLCYTLLSVASSISVPFWFTVWGATVASLKAVCMCFGVFCLALVAGPWCLCKCQRLCRYWLLCNGCVPLCSPTQLAQAACCCNTAFLLTFIKLLLLSLPLPFSPSPTPARLSLTFPLSGYVLFRAVPSRCVLVHSE